MKIGPNQSTIKLSNTVDALVNALADAGHTVAELEKERALLNGLSDDFDITPHVSKSTNPTYIALVLQSIVQESNQNRILMMKIGFH